jgi:probable F420-dependent oxidoreductase
MRYGLAIPQVGSLADPSIIRTVAVEADRAGFASLWALDRLLAPVEPRTPYPAAPDGVLPREQHTVLDPLGVLTLAAAVTSDIRVGTNVLVAPWYPAALLARALTTLDHLSGGRLTVGLGLGWSADEYEAVGVPQRDLAARAEETLDVLDAVWTNDVVEHRGARFQIAPSTILPKPVQRPRPPLLLAAYTPAGLDRIARRADGWTPAGLPVGAIAPMWAMLRDAAAGHGRDPDALDLVVRANIKVVDVPLGADRPSYWGTVEQVVDDLDATRRAGGHEVILDLQACTTTAAELLDLASALVEHDQAAVA